MLRVGEEIRIMDVDHESESLFGGTSSEGEHVLFVAPSGGVVDPDTEPYGVHACFAEQLHALAFGSCFVSEEDGVVLHFAQPTKVSSFRP